MANQVHRSHLDASSRQSRGRSPDGRWSRRRRLDRNDRLTDITYDLARQSGFESVKESLQVARHGSGNKVYLIGSITCLRAVGCAAFHR